jgi:hypothetical protein
LHNQHVACFHWVDRRNGESSRRQCS